MLSTPPAFILSQDQTLRGICSRAEARDSRSVIRTDIRSGPPAPGKEAGVVWTQTMSRRFGLLMDPLDMTGLCGSLCEPYWLVTVSGFQGSSCSGFPAYPAVLPAACRLSCVRRQGDTIRTRPEAVNGLSELFSITLSAGFRAWIQATKSASRIHRKAPERRSIASLRLLSRYGFDFRSQLLVFNTRSSV